jgi:hypothetical protein
VALPEEAKLAAYFALLGHSSSRAMDGLVPIATLLAFFTGSGL